MELTAIAEQAVVSPVAFTFNSKLTTPLIIRYKSTFLPDGSEKVVTDWASLMKQVAVLVLNQAGGAIKQQWLYDWFNSAAMMSEGINSMDITIETSAPHGMAMTQEYEVIAIRPNAQHWEDAIDSEEGSQWTLKDLATFYAFWDITREEDINEASYSDIDDALVQWGNKALRDYFNLERFTF